MSDRAANVLMVEARFYDEIADALAEGATKVLDKAGVPYERIAVPGVFEIPAAIMMARQSGTEFSGYISLGCVIRGETDHYEHICREVSRALMEFTVQRTAAHGFGILTCENREQAWVRADVAQQNIGGRAATACLHMMNIRSHPRGA